MRSLLDVIPVLYRLGPANLAGVALHRARLRTGAYLRRAPLTEWPQEAPEWARQARRLFGKTRVPSTAQELRGGPEARAAGDRILAGEMLYFSRHWRPRPPDWCASPITGYQPPRVHWSRLPDFDPQQGDIKWIWEPSRFDWVYLLARAWAASKDERYVEGFWSLLESWRRHNPPNIGPNWKCGQECALRLIALAWAASAFGACGATTPSRLDALWQTVGALAERIEAAIGYALSQHNNHGLAEAAGLYAAGCALPAHPRAGRWRRKGLRLFCRQAVAQFERDGSYSQNSFNYTRHALRIAFVVLRVSEGVGDAVPEEVRRRLLAAVRLLWSAQDEETGRVPNYGANDGANILALSGCGYEDFRPVLQLLHYQLTGCLLYPEGPWDEELEWHFGASALEAPRDPGSRPPLEADRGGYHGLRGPGSFGMLRCHTHRCRPGHADMLHLDLWMNGRSVLQDSGTFQYYDPQGWGGHCKSTAAHNTLEVGGQSQMRPLGRFLWTDWTRSRVLESRSFHLDGRSCRLWSGEHYGYRRLGVVHRRTVVLCDGDWLVVDDALLAAGSPERRLVLRWHLGEGEWRSPEPGCAVREDGLRVQVLGHEGAVEMLQGEEHRPETLVSRHYGEAGACAVLRLAASSGRSVRWFTAVGGEAPLLLPDKLVWKGLVVPSEPGEQPRTP